ncbi:MAG: DUF3987 domain-containing protein [Proteobacteria bacterium]|nr:DUF3987 domain-containing protein [Pseudomonadota bacterium]
MYTGNSQEATETPVVSAMPPCGKANAPEGYLTYFQSEKNRKRHFVDAVKAVLGPRDRYQSYPTYFSHKPLSHDDEPNRIADLYIDFDKDGDIQLTVEEGILTITHFENVYDVPVDEWRISFSGGKGVHLKLKASVLGLEDGRLNLPLILKQLMREVIEELKLTTVDLSIYNMRTGKPFRRENVKRENGFYEVPIAHEDLAASNHDSFILSPRELIDTRPGTLNDKLCAKCKSIETELKKVAETNSNNGEYFPLNIENEPPCIPAILKNREVTAGKCDFNQSMMTVIRWYLANDIEYDGAMENEYFSSFAYEFPSGSLKTRKDRETNVQDRFTSMARAGAEFGCGYAKSLGISLGCDSCSVFVDEEPEGEEAEIIEEAKKAAEQYQKKDAKRVGKLDLGKLPVKLRNHIKEGMKRQDGDPLLLLPAALASAAASIERNVSYAWHGNHALLYCNLYLLTIAGSGAGKTTAINSGALDVRAMNRMQKSEIETEEKLDEPDEDLIQEMKKKLMIIPERTTLEALVKILNEHNGVIFTAEFSGFLKSLKAGGNAFGMMEVVSDIYDCTHDGWNKATIGGGLLTLANPCLSICGFSTLDFLRGELAKSDIGSGALARYLLFYPPTSDNAPTLPKSLPPMSKMTIYEEMADMDPITMTLSKEAEKRASELFKHIHEDIKIYGKNAGSFLEPFVRRWTAHLIKLAMILQQFEKVGSDVIQTKALEGAWHIVSLAMESTKLLFDEKLGISEHQEKCNRVLGYLAKNGGSMTRGQMLKNKVLQNGVKELDYILETLIHSGRITTNGDSLKPKTVLYMKNIG